MTLHDIIVKFNLHYNVKHEHIQYRVYVNDELFTERSCMWGNDYYLEETLIIRAPVGKYHIKCESVPYYKNAVVANNFEIMQGSGSVTHTGHLEI